MLSCRLLWGSEIVSHVEIQLLLLLMLLLRMEMLLFLRRNCVAHPSSGIDVVESRSSMPPSGIHSRSRRHPSPPAGRRSAHRIRRRPRPHFPPNHRLDIEPEQIVHPTGPVESPEDVKGRTVHHRRVSVARTGRRSRGGGG